MTALLPWSATMIAPNEDFNGAPLLRKEFALADGHGLPVKAILRATSFGVFEASINGRPVGEDVLSRAGVPTSGGSVTAATTSPICWNPSTLSGAALGNGWYRGNLSWNGNSAFYGSELAFLGQLDIEFADGFVQTVSTDSTWQSGPPSATLANDLYNGQTIDARLVTDAWTESGFDPKSWVGVHALDFDTARLAEPISRQWSAMKSLSPWIFSLPPQRQDTRGLWAEPGGLDSLHSAGPTR